MKQEKWWKATRTAEDVANERLEKDIHDTAGMIINLASIMLSRESKGNENIQTLKKLNADNQQILNALKRR